MVSASSPRSVLLCVLLFFSTNALAVSAVLGIDLGTEYIKAALVKPGIPLEIVLTKDSRRKETSAVAFKPSQNGPKAGSFPERLYGSDAMALAPRFPADVYPNLKTLLGLPTDDPVVQEYAARHPNLRLEAHKLRGTAAFKSQAFPEEEEAWMVEEMLAMELQSIQRNAEALAGSDTTVRSVVLTVPPFYTIEEKRAVETAAELVGLKVLSLISDGLAVGLNYATSRTFPNVNDGGKPEYHMVFDMGAGSAKATVMKFQGRTVKDVGKFNKTFQEVQVLGSGWDRTLGGDALNYLIMGDMVSRFTETAAAKELAVAAEDIQKHGRATAKLLKEAERLRHVLSANTDTQASFEGLYQDVDFKYKISRAHFEKMAETHAERVGSAVQKALGMADMDISQLDSIILHGGASRTPFVQKQLEKIAGADKLRGNVNSDEAAVFGAGFRAAEISPSFRVKEIRISDGSMYPAGMSWVNTQGKPQKQRLWTERSLLGAPAKEVTFADHEDISVHFFQRVPALDDASASVEKETMMFSTKNLTASVARLIIEKGCAHPDIHFKMGLRLASENGEVEVAKVTVECEVEEEEKEGSMMDGVKNLFGFGKNKDQQPLQNGEEGGAADEESAEATSTTTPAASTDADPTEASTGEDSSGSSTMTATISSSDSAAPAESSTKSTKKQMVTINVDYTVEKGGIAPLSKDDVTAAKDRIKAFEASDRSRRQREETLNQLEGFTYKVRDLLDSESFIGASTAEERADLARRSGEASEWLYGDGADAPREELKTRLKELRDIVSPVERRIEESQKRPDMIKSLRDLLDQTSAFVAGVKKSVVEAEAWASSISAAASASTEETSSQVTAAPSSEDGEFAGLEDEETSAATTASTASAGDGAPASPLYTLEDLKGITELSESTVAWLEEKLAEQEKLPETADPVLTTQDILEKTKRLENASMQLAMKGAKSFDRKGKKKGGSAKKKSTKTNKGATTTTSGPGNAKTADPPDGTRFADLDAESGDGNLPSPEEMEAMIRKLSEEVSPEELEAMIRKQSEEQKQRGEKVEKDREHDEL